MTRLQRGFGGLVLAQVAHFLEEYTGRLWESFPPARFVSGLVSRDLELGFVVVNLSLVTFGVWCFAWPVRRRWQVATALGWLWAGVELGNGTGHLLWSLRDLGYTPGVATAPFLLVLAAYVVRQLRSGRFRLARPPP